MLLVFASTGIQSATDVRIIGQEEIEIRAWRRTFIIRGFAIGCDD